MENNSTFKSIQNVIAPWRVCITGLWLLEWKSVLGPECSAHAIKWLAEVTVYSCMT